MYEEGLLMFGTNLNLKKNDYSMETYVKPDLTKYHKHLCVHSYVWVHCY